MKKFLSAFFAIAMLMFVPACGSKTNTAEDYAEKLVRGEIQPNVNIDSSTKSGKDLEKDSKSSTKPKEIEVSVDSLNTIVDVLNGKYKSLEFLPIESSDFFVGKKLRLVSVLQEHNMSFAYESNIQAEFTESSLMLYSEVGEEPEIGSSNIYEISEPITTPGGLQYVYVALGNDTANEDEGFFTDILMPIKISDTVDMHGYDADTYVLLIENQFPDQYEIFKVE